MFVQKIDDSFTFSEEKEERYPVRALPVQIIVTRSF